MIFFFRKKSFWDYFLHVGGFLFERMWIFFLKIMFKGTKGTPSSPHHNPSFSTSEYPWVGVSPTSPIATAAHCCSLLLHCCFVVFLDEPQPEWILQMFFFPVAGLEVAATWSMQRTAASIFSCLATRHGGRAKWAKIEDVLIPEPRQQLQL